MTFAPPFDSAKAPTPPGGFLQMLEIEEIDRDLYRAGFVAEDEHRLYGGQVAAQALRAAGATVEPGRIPHSLHGYFLRAGDPTRPTVLVVHRDRDGRSYSARRVEAIQDAEVIFSMASSFQVPEDDREEQRHEMPTVEPPEAGEPLEFPRLIAFEGRMVAQPFPAAPWPTRFWARATDALGDDTLTQACALTYLSDISSGSAPFTDETSMPGASLDHAVWFHRPARMEEWTLTDLEPQILAGGRSWYSGTIYDRAGRVVASTVQECLFRTRR